MEAAPHLVGRAFLNMASFVIGMQRRMAFVKLELSSKRVLIDHVQHVPEGQLLLFC